MKKTLTPKEASKIAYVIHLVRYGLSFKEATCRATLNAELRALARKAIETDRKNREKALDKL